MYEGWFMVELYHSMKRFGKRRIGKIVNSIVSFIIFIFGLLFLAFNAIIFAIPVFLLAIFIFVKTVILV